MAKYNEIMEHVKISDEMSSRVLKNIENHFEQTNQMRASKTATHFELPASNRKQKSKWLYSIFLMASSLLLCVCVYRLVERRNPTELSDTNITDANLGQNQSMQQEVPDGLSEGMKQDTSVGSSEGMKQEPREGDQQTSTKGKEGIYEATSVTELSEAVGFTVPEVNGIPFDVTKIIYLAKEGLAEITYLGESDKRLDFRMSRGIDIFKNYNSEDYLGEDEKFVNLLSSLVFMKGNEEKVFFATWTDGEYVYSLDIAEGTDEASMVRMVENLM